MKSLHFLFFCPFDFQQQRKRSHLADSYVTKQYPKEKCSDWAFASRFHLMMFVRYQMPNSTVFSIVCTVPVAQKVPNESVTISLPLVLSLLPDHFTHYYVVQRINR